MADELPKPSPIFPRHVVLGSETLDTPLTLTEELGLEPEGGYPENLSGQLKLDLLINEQGRVIWTGKVSSNLDETVIEFITEKFANAEFSKPTLEGRATKVLIRVEIVLGAQTTD